jgi:5-methylcytosine-specific restriction protein B
MPRVTALDAELSAAKEAALDNVIFAKVPPRLRGERSNRFQKAPVDAHKALAEHRLTRCCETVKSLQDDLEATGSPRFWR